MREIKLDEILLQVIDVREPEEYDDFYLVNSINIPRWQILDRLEEIDKTKEVYVLCATGMRSKFVCALLDNLWYKTVNISDWILHIKETKWN